MKIKFATDKLKDSYALLRELEDQLLTWSSSEDEESLVVNSEQIDIDPVLSKEIERVAGEVENLYSLVNKNLESKSCLSKRSMGF